MPTDILRTEAGDNLVRLWHTMPNEAHEIGLAEANDLDRQERMIRQHRRSCGSVVLEEDGETFDEYQGGYP